MDEEVAVEVLRVLGQKPALDLTNGEYAINIPEYLIGTPTGEILGIMREEAYGAGMYLRREWKGLRWGGMATYSLWRGAEKLRECAVDGPEGKTARSKAYKQLAEMHQKVRDVAKQIREDDLLPTLPVYGDYVLTHAERNEIWKLGAFYHPTQWLWLAPQRTVDDIRHIMKPRASIYLGLTGDYPYRHLAPLNTVSYEDICYAIPPNNRYDRAVYVVATHEAEINAVLALTPR